MCDTIEDRHLVTMLDSIGGPTAAAAAARILGLEAEVERLRTAERILGDHPLILEQDGTSNHDRAIRVIAKLKAEIERLQS